MSAIYPLPAIGRTGLRVWDGILAEEWHPRLQGRRALAIYREMADNDPIIGAFLYTIESLVRQVPWRIEPASEEREAQQVAEFVESCLGDMSHTWDDFLSEVLSLLIYGWSLFEIVYKVRGGRSDDPTRRSAYDDGRIGWRKLAIRGQETIVRWELDDDGGIRGAWQSAPPTYEEVFLPIERCLLFRLRPNRGSPEGYSLLRRAYVSWYYLKRLREIEAIGIERDLAGLPVLEVPPELLHPEATPDLVQLRQQLETLVAEIRRDEREGLILPSEVEPGTGQPTGFRFRLLSTGGQRQLDVHETIVRYEQRIAMTVLAEFLLLGMEQVGSFALASSKTRLFAVALRALLESITSVFNRFAIPRLMELNGIDRKYWPALAHGDIDVPPLDELASYIERLARAGFVAPDEELERYLRKLAGLPERSRDREPVQMSEPDVSDVVEMLEDMRRALADIATAQG